MELYKADVVKKPVRIHNELTVKMKLDLIEDAEKHPTMTQKDLAKKYGIGKSTVGDILRRQKGRLLELKAQSLADSGSSMLNDDSMGFSYEQICRNLISAEKINNNLLNDESLDAILDNNNIEYEYNSQAENDEEDMNYCPPVKTVLEETQDEEIKLISKEEKRENVSKNEKFSEPRIKRRRNNVDNSKTRQLQPILFAGFDLKHLLSPTQLNKCYTALGFPRPGSTASHNESIEVNCESENILEHKNFQSESDDNISEMSLNSIDSDEEQSEMSLLDAYELTQHLCNCMKKLLPECVPYIMKCKSLMEKKLELPATSQQTKISDYFSPSKSS